MVISRQRTQREEKNTSKIIKTVKSSNIQHNIGLIPSYLELVNVLIPNKSEQESFFKECRYITLTEVKPEIVLQYIAGFTRIYPCISLYEFLLTLEKTFNQKREELIQDFSNYTTILTLKQLQVLHTGVPETEALAFLQTFFVFQIDIDVVFMKILLKIQQQLSDEKIFTKFLDALKTSPLTDTFEFHLEWYSLQDREKWLLVDNRLSWVVMLRYLAEHSQLYEQLVQAFYEQYKKVLDRQKNYS